MPQAVQKPDSESVVFHAGSIDLDSPIPYYHQLTTLIEEKVRAQAWRPGQFLPSEQEMCDRLGVSRTVVRQAMSLLVQKGLVIKKSGKRTMITAPAYHGALMQSLKGFYEDAVSRGQRPYTRVLELRVIPAGAEVAGALQLKEGDSVIMLTRLRFLDGVPEVIVATYIPEHFCPSVVEQDFSNQSLYALLARDYGLVISRGYRTIEAVALDKAEAKLLQVRPGSPALLLKSIGELDDGTPLEYYVARHRGDRCKFHVRLVRSNDTSEASAASGMAAVRGL